MKNNEKYNELIESIELNQIEVVELECYQNEDFNPEKRSNLDIGVRHDIKNVKFEGIEMHVHFEFEVTAFNNEQDNEQGLEELNREDLLFKIKFLLNLKYYLEAENIEEFIEKQKEEINIFVDRNVPINAWPYARETVSSLSTRMGFPALVLPSFKNIPKY